MRHESVGSVVFRGRLAVPGKRRVGMAILALLVTLFVFALLAYPASAQTLQKPERKPHRDECNRRILMRGLRERKT